MSRFDALIVVVFSLLLSACAAPVRDVRFDCGPWNFGIAKPSSHNTQFVEDKNLRERLENQRQHCLQTTFAQGFSEYDPPIDARFTYRTEEVKIVRRPVRVDADLDLLQKPKLTEVQMRRNALQNDEFRFEFDAYSDWSAAEPPSKLYQVFSKKLGAKAALFLSVYDANPFLIWSDARDSMYLRLRGELVYSDLGKVQEVQFRGKPGFQIEYRGRDKHGAPLHFLSTQIQMGKKVLYLSTWCFEEDYAANEKEFHLIADSLVMHDSLSGWRSAE